MRAWADFLIHRLNTFYDKIIPQDTKTTILVQTNLFWIEKSLLTKHAFFVKFCWQDKDFYMLFAGFTQKRFPANTNLNSCKVQHSFFNDSFERTHIRILRRYMKWYAVCFLKSYHKMLWLKRFFRCIFHRRSTCTTM